MPFSEFISSGDLKFIILFILLSGVSIFHFIKKLKSSKSPEELALRNSRINLSALAILLFSGLSLLLGLLHGFYMMGEVGGISQSMMFKGLSYTLITPVLGLVFYMGCKLLQAISNTNTVKP